jgi:hypothetical protein
MFLSTTIILPSIPSKEHCYHVFPRTTFSITRNVSESTALGHCTSTRLERAALFYVTDYQQWRIRLKKIWSILKTVEGGVTLVDYLSCRVDPRVSGTLRHVR